MRSRVTAHVVFAVLLSSLVVSGCLGVDFGNHWDEHRMTTSVRLVVESGRPLPAWYNYPSTVHHLVWLSLAPEFIAGRGDGERVAQRLFDARATTARFKKHILLRLRTVFLIVTLLTRPVAAPAGRCCQHF